MDAAAAQMHDDGERSYGGSWVLVRRMIEQGKFKVRRGNAAHLPVLSRSQALVFYLHG